MCVSLPAALQNPQRKTRLGFLGMYPLCFLILSFFFIDLGVFLSVLESPSRVRVCCAARGASEPSNKNTPLDFWSMYPMGFIDFCSLFHDSGTICARLWYLGMYMYMYVYVYVYLYLHMYQVPGKKIPRLRSKASNRETGKVT